MDENNQAESKKARNHSDASTYLSDIDGIAKYMYLKANYLDNLTEEEKETIDKSGVKDLLAKLSKTNPKCRYAIDSQDTGFPFWKHKNLEPLFDNTKEEKIVVNPKNYKVFIETKQPGASLICKCVYLPKSIFEEIPESEILCGGSFSVQEYIGNCFKNKTFADSVAAMGKGESDPFVKSNIEFDATLWAKQASDLVKSDYSMFNIRTTQTPCVNIRTKQKSCDDINIDIETLKLSGLTNNEKINENKSEAKLDKELESIRYIGNNFEKDLNIILNKISLRNSNLKFSWHHEGNLIVNQAKTKIMYIHLAKAYEGLKFLLSEREARQKISKLLEEMLRKVF